MTDLTDILDPEYCLADLRFADKAACLGDLARRAAAALNIAADQIIEALQHRETLGSTGLGKGIALPHARLATLGQPFILLAHLREPIAFDAVDDRPVDIVCLVLLPVKTAGQINILAAAARRLRDPTTLRSLRAAKDGATLYAALKAIA